VKENDAFFVTTNVIITTAQTQGHCPEVSASLSFSVSLSVSLSMSLSVLLSLHPSITSNYYYYYYYYCCCCCCCCIQWLLGCWSTVKSSSKLRHVSKTLCHAVLCQLLLQGGHKPGKPGILRDFSEHGELREFSGDSVQPQGKIVTNKVF